LQPPVFTVCLGLNCGKLGIPNTDELRRLIRCAMRIVNRTAVSVVGKQPYIDWTRKRDADANAGLLTAPRVKPFGTAILLPEFELEEDVLEWIEENVTWLFELQLSEWTEEESTWPQTRDLKTFREWFRVDIHSTVIDEGEDEIEGEEL
jgi:hypothetical protein